MKSKIFEVNHKVNYRNGKFNEEIFQVKKKYDYFHGMSLDRKELLELKEFLAKYELPEKASQEIK